MLLYCGCWCHLVEGRSERVHYTGRLYKLGPGQVVPLVIRQLYLSLSSRVTRLVIRPHIRPIRNNMQMLPLITDNM